MPAWKNNDDPRYTARAALQEFAARGIDMPDSVTAAVDTLERIVAARPAKPPVDALRKLIVDGADEAEINDALLADLGHQRLFAEYQQAEQDAARTVTREIRNAADTLFPQLEQLARNAISTLEAVAGLGDTDLATLVRQGRHDDARALADFETVGEELHHLYALRDDYLTPGGFKSMLVDGVDCTQWSDPRKPHHHGRGSDTVAQAYVR
ncbi:hypothetical protein ACQKHK_12660, partial [Staphylococcus capitis]|uniref:hypothetical protein n=1 Tax=Staphylococcus capitis TaxID=29388 RepID=UPI003CFF40F1